MSLSVLFQQKMFKLVTIVAIVLALVMANFGIVSAAGVAPGAVYVETNQATGNAIAIFNRSTDGTLSFDTMVSTGGFGTSAGLGSEGAIALSNDGRWLFAVNAGSNDISSFRVDVNGLTLVGKVASGGMTPISLTLYKNLLYVLNGGGNGNITGFTVDPFGKLNIIAGSSRPLSSNNAGPAQVSFSPDGSTLVVTEKATSMIDT